MEQLHNGFTLHTPTGTFPLSTDSMLLSGFVRLTRNAGVLDLGSGCGTLGILLCANDPGCHVTGIEQNVLAHEAALENIHRNGLRNRMHSICGDLRTLSQWIQPGSFSCCISNPPYFSGGPSGNAQVHARRDDICSPDELFRAAAWALQYGGDFFLVHRPERLAELCSRASVYQLEAKRLCLVHHKQIDPVSLILLQFRKGGKPGLKWESMYLRESDGSPSEAYRTLYHL